MPSVSVADDPVDSVKKGAASTFKDRLSLDCRYALRHASIE
jgi:hypothetical protein